MGYRYRLYRKGLPGKPDLVFPKFRLVVLVHGCYWHGHVCREARRPNTNLSYWTPKLEGNMARDKRVQNELQDLGWEVFVIRECTVEQNIADLLELLNARKLPSE
jgi:DNA mismatch endonuclease (patch repair protein)